ncbi:MAG: succinate dehydrogenase, hydrophobic membrane anchor protein [Proteobacteria bacterium]|nr:succinate dehydrogenase, hydrophobic membrane anchor protein [Pseudomonadota bacterium]
MAGKESIRTPLGKVRGLGSAKHGAGHFITQRVSAIALLFLVPWFLISLIGAVRGGYDGALVWVADPINAVLTLLAVGTALYHMRLGMQVVIEDYIAKHGTRNLLLILNTFICIALFATAAYAVLKIAIAA